ncbi:polyphosphate kinase 2 [Brooklawnia cerclae]|uniref:ADP/GDP-polyphosphate phosphotransferase n=1 Tax=Brooklawnia cerclae TaxID=349934 RepID=A0ABX0SJA3_9ACTN|nr:polyphosphate kinase 2 [Brooklawnia cerclae]NIH56827.1 polyphosphate kinase 2 [Brooklawnia cerclae]
MDQREFREYIDWLRAGGYTVLHDITGSDPDLITPEGSAIDTWRDDYPYDNRLDREAYEAEKYSLQVELIKFQDWTRETGTRHIVVFEGRDAAGKGGTIKRFSEHLNPRYARIVALPKPNRRERGQWFLQRYIEHFPTAGEIVLFDRSWYNRAGVEPVMGFCSPDDYQRFMREAPALEEMLIESGTSLTKFYLAVTRNEQRTRFAIRQLDPVRRWKLSPMDVASLGKWDEYTAAAERMFEQTDTELAPWTWINANDKKRGRLNAMRAFLDKFDYTDKDPSVVFAPDELLVKRGRDTLRTLAP